MFETLIGGLSPSPYRGPMGDHWQRGHDARLAGIAREACPLSDYPARSLRRAWFEGWDAARPALPIVKRVPVVVAQEPAPVVIRGTFGVPGHSYQPPACPFCRATTLDGGAQAAVVTPAHGGARCRACGRGFNLPARASKE